jgi:hemoglobin
MSDEPHLVDGTDVRSLIERFYTRVRPDPLIGHFFTELDWDHHIPHITAFWNMVLFGDHTFQGDPMTAHKKLHARILMRPEHFSRWLELFHATVDELYSGPKAEEAKQRATTIAGVMMHKVL